jgi:hypothetical protein
MSSDLDFDNIANRLFGATTPTAAVDHGADLRQAIGRGEPLPPTPDLPARDEHELAKALYDGPIHVDAERAIQEAILEDLGDPVEAAETAAMWADTFTAMSLNASESARIAGVAIDVARNPPSGELVTSWVEQAKEHLVTDFGARGASQALVDARRLIEVHGSPELRDVLNMTGLGNHPQLVRLAAQKARALRLAGRL